MLFHHAAALLRSSTRQWSEYLAAHPDWDTQLMEHIGHRTLSLSPVFHNWTKLGDCFESPVLRDRVLQLSAELEVNNPDIAKEWRPFLGVLGHVRRMQLKALLLETDTPVNLLLKTPDLTARGSFFLDAQYTPQSLFAGFLLKKGDIYPVHSLSTSERPVYGTGGTVIGDAAATATLLARYQRVFSQAMHTFKPGAWSRAKLAWDSKHAVADTHHVAMLARLWHPQGLSTEQKLALALTWENQTGVLATQKDDRRLNPKQAQQWEHWALHARTYLQLSGANDDAKGAALVEALAGCPAPKQKGDSEMKLPELGFSLEVSS